VNGNVETATQTVVLDRVAPAGRFADQSSGLLIGSWFATTSLTQTLKLLFGDVGTGLYQMQFSTDGGATWSALMAYSGSATVQLPNADGLYTVTVRVTDMAGNSAVFSQSVRLDRAGPTISSSQSAPTNAGSYDLGATFVFSYGASDVDGVSTISAKVDGATAISSGGSVNLFSLTVGTHTVTVTATDALGNVSTTTTSFQVHATIGGLINAVNYGGSKSLIQNTVQSTLLSTLKSAQSALTAGNTASAKSYLTTFVNQAKQLSGKIDAAFGALLTNWANDLIARL
jgi:hypothetical protein